MKKIGLFSLTILTLLATAAHAAGAGSNWLGVDAGLSLPFGDFADQASTGFNLGLTGDHLIRDNVAFGGELGWHVFGGTDELEKTLSVRYGAPAQLTYRIIPVLGHAKFFLPASQQMAPFLEAGLGLFNVKQKTDFGTTREKSSTRVGIQLGAGASFKSTEKMKLGAEALYHYISTADKATNMVTLRGQLMFGL